MSVGLRTNKGKLAMSRIHRHETHAGVFAAFTAALLVGCGSGSDAAGNRAEVTTPATTRVAGNEAIPDIGRLSSGGTASNTGGPRSSAGGAISARGGASSSAGGVTNDASSIQGGTQGNPNGGATNDTSSDRGGTDGNPNGGATNDTSTARGGRDGGTRSVPTGGARTSSSGTLSASGAGGTSSTTSTTGVANATGGVSAYHTLTNWVSPSANNKNHHGRVYFIAGGKKDDQGLACTSCHGANFEGTTSAPACASCHSNWRSCDFCHGKAPNQFNPPRGVMDEATTATMAVGRHIAHLTGSNSHAAFACNSCHTIPAANDLAHLVGYVPSSDLSTPGHHGDVSFSGTANGTTWNVNATTGNPVSARGTCIGACHSNGRGGNPVKTPYWAGGAWNSGCTNCHGATGSTRGEHGHGFPGSTCADCHTGASATSYTAATHLNGKRDFRTSPGGAAAGMTLSASWGCSNVRCHEDGED